MWYLIGIPVGLYVALRIAASVYGEAIVMPRVYEELSRKKNRAVTGDKAAIEEWKRVRLSLREFVLRARRGDPEYIKIVNQLLAHGLLDEYLIRN